MRRNPKRMDLLEPDESILYIRILALQYNTRIGTWNFADRTAVPGGKDDHCFKSPIGKLCIIVFVCACVCAVRMLPAVHDIHGR